MRLIQGCMVDVEVCGGRVRKYGEKVTTMWHWKPVSRNVLGKGKRVLTDANAPVAFYVCIVDVRTCARWHGGDGQCLSKSIGREVDGK